jgi:hypothetical protein
LEHGGDDTNECLWEPRAVKILAVAARAFLKPFSRGPATLCALLWAATAGYCAFHFAKAWAPFFEPAKLSISSRSPVAEVRIWFGSLSGEGTANLDLPVAMGHGLLVVDVTPSGKDPASQASEVWLLSVRPPSAAAQIRIDTDWNHVAMELGDGGWAYRTFGGKQHLRLTTDAPYLDLRFLTHPWSGRVSLHSEKTRTDYDLYSPSTKVKSVRVSGGDSCAGTCQYRLDFDLPRYVFGDDIVRITSWPAAKAVQATLAISGVQAQAAGPLAFRRMGSILCTEILCWLVGATTALAVFVLGAALLRRI